MSAPPVSPYFFDRELRNGVPDMATLTRRLMRWQEWARDRWACSTPCSSGRFGVDGVITNGNSHAFYVAPPPVPCRRLSFRFKADSDQGSVVATIRSRRTGLVLEQVTVAGLSGADGSGTVTVDAPDIIDLSVSATGDNGISAFSAWWDLRAEAPAGVTLPTTWSTIAPGFVTAGRADSVHLLRWLALASNQMLADRPPMAICAGHVASAMSIPLVVSPRVPSLTVKVLCETGALTPSAFLHYYTPALGAGTTYNAAGAPGAWSWATITIPIQGHPQNSLVHVDLRSTSADIRSILVYENEPTGTDIGQTVPAAFIAPATQQILSRAPILADADSGAARTRGRKALVENLYWLLAHKTRVLMCETAGQYHNAAATDGTLLRFRIRTAADGITRQIRVRANLSPGAGYPGNGQTFGWGQYASDNGGAASWKMVSEAGPVAQDGWVAEEVHSVASGSEFVYRRRRQNPNAEVQSAENIQGVVFEQLPSGTPVTAWP